MRFQKNKINKTKTTKFYQSAKASFLALTFLFGPVSEVEESFLFRLSKVGIAAIYFPIPPDLAAAVSRAPGAGLDKLVPNHLLISSSIQNISIIKMNI